MSVLEDLERLVFPGSQSYVAESEFKSPELFLQDHANFVAVNIRILTTQTQTNTYMHKRRKNM